MVTVAQRRIENARKLDKRESQLMWLKFQQSQTARAIYVRHAAELRAAFLKWQKDL